MLTFLYISGFLFARSIIGLQAGYSAPFPPAPPPPSTTPPVTFLMVLSLSTIINSGYFKNGPLEPG